MKEIFFIGLIIAVSWIVGQASRTRRTSTYREAADGTGLKVSGKNLSGEFNGYQVRASEVRRKKSKYSSVGVTVLEVELHTLPEGLRIGLETFLGRVMGFFGAPDIALGDDRFDRVFDIGGADELAARQWLADDRRRNALIDLDECVDDLRIEDGWLKIELPCEAADADEVRKTVEWIVTVARRIDEPRPGFLSTPDVSLRPRRTRQPPIAALGAIVLVAGVMVWMFTSAFPWLDKNAWSPSPTVDPVASSTTDDEAFRSENPFARCVEETPNTYDADFSRCRELLDETGYTAEVRSALRTVAVVEARQGSRVALDRKAALSAARDFASLTDERSPGDIMSNREGARALQMYWDSGLVKEYLGLSPPGLGMDDPMIDLSVSLDVMHNFGKSFGRHTHRYDDHLAAARCLIGIIPNKTSREHRDTFAYACSGDETLSTTGLSSRSGQRAALDVDPQWVANYLAGLVRSRRDVDELVVLGWYASQLGSKHGVKHPLNLDELEARIDPVECASPWGVHDSLGPPQLWEAALPNAGRFESLMRLFAARQWYALGETEKMQTVLDGIDPYSREAVCAAQLQTAVGDATGALERLTVHSESEDAEAKGLAALAAAHAHALKGDWKEAADRAREVLKAFDGPETRVAAIIMAAADEDGDDDLYDAFGPIPEAQQMSTANVARWFAQAARSEELATKRWVAPDLKLEPGAEWIQFHIAARLAPADKAEYWLDVVMPSEGFDAFALAKARQIAAQQRGDTKAAKKWGAIVREHRGAVDTPSTARLMRIARTSAPR